MRLRIPRDFEFDGDDDDLPPLDGPVTANRKEFARADGLAPENWPEADA